MAEIPTTLMCPQCGSTITDEFGFCPACGFEYRKKAPAQNGSSNVRMDTQAQKAPNGRPDIMEQYSRYLATYNQKLMESNRKMTIFMLSIWVGIAFVLGITSFCIPDSMLEDYEDVTGLSKELAIEGAVFIVSGLFALVSLILCVKVKKYQVAYLCCFASAFSTLGLLYAGSTMCIYLVLCGLLTSLRMRNFRKMFKD